jgi:hypothetical protein
MGPGNASAAFTGGSLRKHTPLSYLATHDTPKCDVAVTRLLLARGPGRTSRRRRAARNGQRPAALQVVDPRRGSPTTSPSRRHGDGPPRRKPLRLIRLAVCQPE